MSYEPTEQLGVGQLRISDKAKRYVNEALDANRLSYGPFSRRFEAMFAELHHVRHAVLSNSGTSSLQVALAALKEKYGWSDGDEVLVPAITFVATANVVLMLGMKPVFVDVDARTYNMDPAQIARHVTPRTRAMIPVHMFGLPANMPAICSVAESHGLRIIEDSCECMFVGIGGKPVGTFSDVACFSTYVAHLLVTGVGGLSVTDDDELAVMMRSLCNHGRNEIYLAIDDDKGLSGSELRTVMSKRFEFVRLGFSYRVTEMEAALGLAQLEDHEQILRTRQANAAYLIDALRGLESDGLLQLPTVPDGMEHAFMLFPILVTNGSRDDLTFLLESRAVETRPMMPLIGQPIYRAMFGDLAADYPVASKIDESGFYIGCHEGFDKQQLDHIVGCFLQWARSA